MKLTQSWVGYLDRSYQQIKTSLLARLVVNNPEISDHNEGNIFIIIISMFSGIAEMLNYYIDTMGREAFMGTAQRFSSVIKLARLIDYNGKAATMASADLLFTLTQNGLLYTTPNPIIIPKETFVTSSNGIIFRTLKDATIGIGQSGAYSTAQQWQDVINDILDVTSGLANQSVLLPVDYVDGSLILVINGELWTPYESLGYMFPGTRGFIVILNDDGLPYAVFGDGLNGKIPDAGLQILGNYKVTQGEDGNLAPGAINQIQSTSAILPNGITLNVINQDYSNSGGGVESIEEIRNRAPRALRTLNRAVTVQDYKDISLQVPEVGEAEVSYCCGNRYIKIYISPKTKGAATTALLQKVLDYDNARRMVGTSLNVLAAGLSKLWMKVDIYARPLVSTNSVLIEVINLLDDNYGFSNSYINRSVSVSDIIALMEQAKTVDHVDISQLRVLPFVRPQNPNTTLLDIEFTGLPVLPVTITYTIIYVFTSSVFQVFKGSKLQVNVGLEQEYNDGTVRFKIHSANYQPGDKWQFIAASSYPETFPISQIKISDFSMPIFDIGPELDSSVPKTIYSELNVITSQPSSSACLPNCP